MARIIGLTGGIGSGKSTVAKIFEEEFCPVFITDTEAKRIQLTDPEAIKGMKVIFGNDIYLAGGNLDTAKLSKIVFNDKDKLQQLNNLIHPLVRKHFINWVETNKEQPFVVIESAILVQSGFYNMCDFNILVTASIESRIERVMKRNGLSRDQIMQRIKNQISDSENLKFCKYTIENEDLGTLKNQIEKIVEKEFKN